MTRPNTLSMSIEHIEALIYIGRHAYWQTNANDYDHAVCTFAPLVRFVLFLFLEFFSGCLLFSGFMPSWWVQIFHCCWCWTLCIRSVCHSHAVYKDLRSRNRRRCQLNFMKNRGCIHLASVLMINARACKCAAEQWQNKLPCALCARVCCSFFFNPFELATVADNNATTTTTIVVHEYLSGNSSGLPRNVFWRPVDCVLYGNLFAERPFFTQASHRTDFQVQTERQKMRCDCDVVTTDE